MKNRNGKMNIREIADLAKVSTATVSRALHSPEKVQPETLSKVMEVVNAYSYKPRRSMPSSSKMIAFFLNEVNNTFFNEVIRHLTEYARQDGYIVMVLSSNHHRDLEYDMLDYCERLGCAGIILTGLTEITDINSSIPTVLLDGSNKVKGNYLTVSSDDDEAIRLLVEHLIRLNHTKIGFISGGNNNAAGEIRENYYLEHMKRYGKAVSERSIFKGAFDVKSGMDAFDYFYSQKNMPTGIIAANDEMAKGFIIRANSLGVKIPEDISICGVDSVDVDTFLPRITSIQQDINGIAREIFQFVKTNKENPRSSTVTLPVKLMYGDTCYRQNE